MNKGHTSEERISGWEPELKVPPTTLWLPLGNDLPAKEIGRKAAVKILGRDTSKDDLQKFSRIVSDGITDCRRRGVKRGGLLFFPDYNRLPPIANIDVYGFYSKDPARPTSLEFYRELYGTPTERTIGPIEVTNLQLPIGPAVRFHQRYWPKPSGDPIVHEWEEVRFAVVPPQIDSAVVLKVGWVEPQFSEALIKMADAIAQTLEIKLLDA
ncbi:MAG TPA: hypothetical protein VHT26_18970 [Trebonia sp.]|jgi:hypothetical protein|nr:hypothetical protein [Trebonia sp.]